MMSETCSLCLFTTLCNSLCLKSILFELESNVLRIAPAPPLPDSVISSVRAARGIKILFCSVPYKLVFAAGRAKICTGLNHTHVLWLRRERNEAGTCRPSAARGNPVMTSSTAVSAPTLCDLGATKSIWR